MKTIIQSIHFNADARLLNLIEEKIQHFDHFLSELSARAEVILKLEKVGKIQDKIVEIILFIQGDRLVVKSNRKSFEEALFDAVKALKNQLLKYKSKIQKR